MIACVCVVSSMGLAGMSHVTRVTKSRTCETFMSRTWMKYVTRMELPSMPSPQFMSYRVNELFQTYESACHTHESVMLPIDISRDTANSIVTKVELLSVASSQRGHTSA